ncbi:hypothetical protein ILUMI_25106, partial [Ignelater luminosus]
MEHKAEPILSLTTFWLAAIGGRRLLQGGCTPEDKRGKHRSGNALKLSEVMSVMGHISLFPTKQTHYGTREHNYLDAELNVTITHSLFLEKHPESKVKYEYYNKVFRENFNLSFGRPQVDVCNDCETVSLKPKNKSLNDTAKRVTAAELLFHKRRSKKFYNALKASKELCLTRLILFDFMQFPAQDLFYLSQLTIDVFGVHNMRTNNAVFFMYHEGQAKKSPNEICSFLLQYINTYIDENITELQFFCDNYPGQNTNHAVLRVCSAFVNSGRFQKVEIYFPIRGHSFLPSDRDFGLIKRKLKKIDRIYTLMEYVELIISEIGEGNILRKLETSARSVPRNATEHFNISKYHYFCSVIVGKDFTEGTIINTFPLLLPGVITTEMPVDLATPNGKVPISTTKMDHIKKSYTFVD